MQLIGENVYPEVVEPRARVISWLGPIITSIFKVNFRLEDIPFYDAANIKDYFSHVG